MPPSPSLRIDRGFTREQMARIVLGSLPESMDDKWVIYAADDDCALYFHRSWTGAWVYTVHFEAIGDGGARATSIVIDPGHRRPDEERFVMGMVEWLLR
jgi:hypothetical protein